MRILAVVHQFPPAHETGTEILCLETMKAVAARGHSVRVIAADRTRYQGRPSYMEFVEGIEVVRMATGTRRAFRLPERLRNEFERPQLAERLLEAARQFKPDIVHIHHIFEFGFTTLARLATISPILYTATDFGLICPYAICVLPDGTPCDGPSKDRKNCVVHHLAHPSGTGFATPLTFRNLLERATTALSRAAGIDVVEQVHRAVRDRLRSARQFSDVTYGIFATSERMQTMFRDAGLAQRAISVLPHLAPPLQLSPRAVSNPLKVGFFGTVLKHKGAHVLVEAVRKIPADVPLDVVVCGNFDVDPAYFSNLQQMAGDDRRIRFSNSVPYSAFGEVLSAVDIVVVPSLWMENAPLVLLAATNGGRYAVVSDVEGLTGRLDCPRQGQSFPRGDSHALARLLEGLVRDPNPVLRARNEAAVGTSFSYYIDAVEERYSVVLRSQALVQR